MFLFCFDIFILLVRQNVLFILYFTGQDCLILLLGPTNSHKTIKLLQLLQLSAPDTLHICFRMCKKHEQIMCLKLEMCASISGSFTFKPATKGHRDRVQSCYLRDEATFTPVFGTPVSSDIKLWLDICRIKQFCVVSRGHCCPSDLWTIK